MTIKTKRLVLRPWCESDAESLYKYASNPRVGTPAGWRAHTSLAESLEIIKTEFNSPHVFAVCEKGGEAVGAVGLKFFPDTDMTEKGDECELGYWLGEELWGRGYMPEAALALLRHAFVNLQVAGVWVGYYDGNDKSRRVQEKLGFVYHHTTPDLFVSAFNETRVGHVGFLSKEHFANLHGEKQSIKDRLLAESDAAYAAFQAKLTPNVDPSLFIGVRVPDARKLAKAVIKEGGADEFLSCLPHETFDENLLHGLILSEIKDYGECVARVDAFLPYVDNWAVCDIMSPKCFKKNKTALIEKIREWSACDKVYTARFGLEMLMSHFLDEDFKSEYLEIAAAVTGEDYYIKMMVAWFFATALAKQWDETVKYIENGRLEKWTHNKTIQKARESYRISEEQKEYLKGFKK